LLRPHPTERKDRTQFSTLRKGLRLIVPEQDPQLSSNPADISHLYKGYAPLSIRLVEEAVLKGGWGPASEVLSLLPGAQFDVLQVSLVRTRATSGVGVWRYVCMGVERERLAYCAWNVGSRWCWGCNCNAGGAQQPSWYCRLRLLFLSVSILQMLTQRVLAVLTLCRCWSRRGRLLTSPSSPPTTWLLLLLVSISAQRFAACACW
jgi:hypothetical protein